MYQYSHGQRRRRHRHRHHYSVQLILVLSLVSLYNFKAATATFIIPQQQQNGYSSCLSSVSTALHASRPPPPCSSSPSRRSFVASMAAIVTSLPVAETPNNADNIIANAIDIKVTPLAHTFVTSDSKGKGIAKPVRENDFTRFLTNARVVVFFLGSGDGGGEQEVTRLTKERKEGKGPGVTPGNIVISAAKKATSLETEVSSLGNGDTLIVTVPSVSFTADKKVTSDCATSLGLFLGGAKGGGVVSLLIDGSKSVNLDESGYDLLWYSLSR